MTRAILPLLVLLLWFAPVSFAQEHGEEMKAGFYAADKIEWKQGPKSIPAGAKAAMLEGDATKEGSFVMRIKLPDGYMVPLHTHPKTERLTVISGTFNIEMDGKTTKMPAGTFGFWAAGMKHKVWATGETVVQLHGVGPWQINYVDPKDDPRNRTPKK